MIFENVTLTREGTGKREEARQKEEERETHIIHPSEEKRICTP